MNNLKLLYYDRIDVSEGTNINKTSSSRQCDICRYWHFVDKGFKFQPNVCNGCPDLLMLSMNLSDQTLKVLIMAVLLVELPKLKL